MSRTIERPFSRRSKKSTKEKLNQPLPHLLNEAFKKERSIIEVAELLQQIQNPIFVDFNNVLVNNQHPMVPNPDALAPFHELRKIGTVIVLTLASDWQIVQEFLQEFGYWADDVILITAPSYMYHMSNESDSEADALRAKYVALARQHNLFNLQQIPEEDVTSKYFWRGVPADKKIGFVFMKPHLIPLIDDYEGAVTQNPGILGIKVDPWYAPSDGITQRTSAEKRMGLADALEIIREHYRQLQSPGLE